MRRLFISYTYAMRAGNTYDKGYGNGVFEAPGTIKTGEDIEALTVIVEEQLKELHRADAISIVILNFKEL